MRKQAQQQEVVPEPGTAAAHGIDENSASNADFTIAALNEELYKRAVARETELLDKLRALKIEVTQIYF